MATMTASHDRATERHDAAAFPRLLWVGPLTVVVALLVNLVIKTLLQALDPSLVEMGQLGRPLVILTLEGAILAVLVFALMVWLVPHPIRWFRIVGVIALVISLIPDLLLGFGGELRRTGSAMVAPFSRLGALVLPAPAGGGGPRGGPTPGDVLPGLPWERVLILMLLHVATAVVCIVLLTTLSRDPVIESRRQS